MRRFSLVSILFGLLLAAGALCLGTASAGRGGHTLPHHKEKHVCKAQGDAAAACLAEVVTELDGATPLDVLTPRSIVATIRSGYEPAVAT